MRVVVGVVGVEMGGGSVFAFELGEGLINEEWVA